MSEATGLRLADGSVVECGQTLRSLPGKRHVCAGRHGGRAVISKVFLDRQRGKVHSQRELDGLRAFHNAGIAAPEVLYAGDDSDGNPVIVLARIGDAVALSAVWQQAGPGQRVRLTRRMMELLASHHAAGICQTDLHLDNFLLADGLIYSLDGDGVLAQDGPLDQRRSLQNLALFFSQLSPDQDLASIESSAYYAQLRRWSDSAVCERLPPLIDAARMYRWRKLGSKIYRDCTAVAHLRERGRTCFAVRSAGPQLQSLLSDLDASCPTDPTQRLKNGNTATAWRTGLADRRLVVKRYNVKDRLHGVMGLLKESRASISWRNAHMLGMFGVATPAPLAFCLRREALFRRLGYFLAEDIGGTSLLDWIENHQHDAAEVRRVAGLAGRLFAQLARLQISHGDMKASNFILSAERLFVIDLDSMRLHRYRFGFERAWRRDMARFAANWRDMPQVLEIMREEIESASAG